MKKYFSLIVFITLALSYMSRPAFGQDASRYTLDFESSTLVGITNGIREKRPDENGYCLKIGSSERDVTSKISFPSFSDSSQKVILEADIYFLNNASQKTISVFDTAQTEIVRLMFENQELIGGKDGKAADYFSYTHDDKRWHKLKIEIDNTSKAWKAYWDYRPLFVSLFTFNENNSGNGSVKSVSLSSLKGSYILLDNFSVYEKSETALQAPVSSVYEISGEYKLITGAESGTSVSSFLANINAPDSYIIDRLGVRKEAEESLCAGDSLMLSDGTAYAISLTQSPKSKESVSSDALQLYVSKNGKDANSGKKPYLAFKTLEKAFAAAQNVSSDVIINVMEGTYELSSPSVIRDVNKNKILLKNYNDAKVVFTGGKSFSGSEFIPVTDSTALSRLPEGARNAVRCIDLKTLGIEAVPEMTGSGWNIPFLPTEALLMADGETQTLARYPNTGTIKSGEIINKDASAYYNGGNGGYGKFYYTDARANSWSNVSEIMLHSKFNLTYGGHSIRLGEIDTENKTMTVSEKYYTPPQKSFSYYCYNIMEELDCEGEWYLDKSSMLLYYYPKSGFETKTFTFTDNYDAILRFENCENITLSGIAVENCGGNGIEMTDCRNFTVDGCTVSGIGMNGITVYGGENNAIVNSEITGTGGDGIRLTGGDFYTLTPSGNLVYNTVISDFSKRKKAYTGALSLNGAGHTVKNCSMYNGPHLAVWLKGNDFTLENNIISDVVYDAADMGAIYAYNNYAWRGTVIKNNLFKNIRYGGAWEANMAKCIYLDNFSSGYTVEGNVFINADEAIHTNGGRNNIITDNFIKNCTVSFVAPYQKMFAPPYYTLSTAPVNSQLWSGRYVGTADTASDFAGYPKDTYIGGNTVERKSVKKVDIDSKMLLRDNTYYSDNREKMLYTAGAVSKNAGKNKELYIYGEKPLKINESVRLNAVIMSERGRTPCEPVFKSSNIGVLNVGTDGIITARGLGTAVITASFGGLTKSAALTVTK